MTTKDGSDWIMRHGEEAHGNPYIGAKWTSVREPDMKAEAAQLGGSGPRQIRTQGGTNQCLQLPHAGAHPRRTGPGDCPDRGRHRPVPHPLTPARRRAGRGQRTTDTCSGHGSDEKLQRDAEAEWECEAGA